MKKIFFTVLVVITTFLIYFFNKSEKIYYLSLGDYLSYGINNFNKVENNHSTNIKKYYENILSNYVNYSSYDDYRVMDLINDINYNKTIEYKNKEYKIQNLLIKSNLITISVGMNDLIYKSKYDNNLYKYIDELLKDIDALFKLIRKYNKDEIYFLGFYDIINNKEIIEYTNNKVKSICNKNKINFVDISLLNNYISKGNYPTNDGYSYITESILTLLK